MVLFSIEYFGIPCNFIFEHFISHGTHSHGYLAVCKKRGEHDMGLDTE